MSLTGTAYGLKLVLPQTTVKSWRGSKNGDASSKLFTMLSASHVVINMVEDSTGVFWAGFDSLEECHRAMASSVVRGLVASANDGSARAVVVDWRGNPLEQTSSQGIAQRIRMVYEE